MLSVIAAAPQTVRSGSAAEEAHPVQRRAVLRRGRADGGCCLHRFFADLEVQHHLEAGALAQLALQRDDTAHHVHNVFGDRHSKTGSSNPILRNSMLS